MSHGAAELSDEQRQLLKNLYDEQYVNRDHLPYTEDFDRLCEKFNAMARLNLSHYEIWVALIDLV